MVSLQGDMAQRSRRNLGSAVDSRRVFLQLNLGALCEKQLTAVDRDLVNKILRQVERH